ncbi:MAG: nuclear transport factor 2 family protein [Bacteroidales bacterium]|nr:MAG: nuclear transport factor 2 family protein [Bacteroidales bacterium]
MKKLTFSFPVLIIVLSILFSCAQNTKDADVEADIAAINELVANYFRYANALNLDSFMTAFADNAIRAEPGLPSIIGKDNIRERFRIIWDEADFKISQYGEVIIEVCGDQAFTYRLATLSSFPGEGEPAIHTDMKVLTVFKRQADGSWRIYIDCVNLHPTWSKDSIPSEMVEEQSPYY